jgi:hypothetical protein
MNKRTLLLNLIAAICVVTGSGGVCAQAGAIVNAEDHMAKERAHRAIGIKAISPSLGINTGLVIAYGHPIAPPYHFEYRGSLLFVNGVQVEPSLIQQRDYDQLPKKMTDGVANEMNQLIELEHKVKSVFAERHGTIPDDELRAQLLGMVRAHPMIKDAKWTNSKVLSYKRTNDPHDSFSNGIILRFTGHSASAATTRKSSEQLHQEHINQFEEHLKSGGCLFFLSDGGVWRGMDMRKDVNQIMNRSDLSASEKEQKLHSVFNGTSGPDLDISANYNASEWK